MLDSLTSLLFVLLEDKKGTLFVVCVCAFKGSREARLQVFTKDQPLLIVSRRKGRYSLRFTVLLSQSVCCCRREVCAAVVANCVLLCAVVRVVLALSFCVQEADVADD